LPKSVFETINLDEAANPPSFSQKRKEYSSMHHQLTHDVKGAIDYDDLDAEEIETELVKEVEGLVENDGNGQAEIGEDTLSDLDNDPEVLNSIAMSDDEAEFKKELWLAENHDWVKKQQLNELNNKGGKKSEHRKVLILLMV
jgi:hypothetical protein